MQQQQWRPDGTHSVAWYAAGPAQGPTIACVHGNSTGAWIFEPLFTRTLLASYRLVAIDLPGHGASARWDGPQAYTIEWFGDLLRDWIAHVRTGPVIAVGHSLGGHLLSQAVARLAIEGLMLIGAPPLRGPGDMVTRFLPTPGLPALFTEQLTPNLIAAWQTVNLHLPRPGLERDQDRFASAVAATDGRVRARIGADVGAGRMLDELAALRRSGLPVADVVGADERIIAKRAPSTEPWPSLWQGAPIQIPDAGHLPLLDQPHAMADPIAAFARHVGLEPAS